MKKLSVINSEIYKKLKSLEGKINKLNKEYYDNNNSIVSDQVYDAFLLEVREILNENPVHKVEFGYLLDSVGFINKNDNLFFKKIKHSYRLYSLNNSFNEEDLINFDKKIKRSLSLEDNENIEYILQLKLDGLALSIEYDLGKIKRTLTRGDGFMGEDITENSKHIIDFKKNIESKDSLSIRGEAYISNEDYVKLQKNSVENINQRNLASGTLKLHDSSVIKERRISFSAFDVFGKNLEFESYLEKLEFLRKNGFDDSKTFIGKFVGINAVIRKCLTIDKDIFDLPADGIVIKVNDISMQNSLGYTSKYPRYAIAYKFPEELVQTKLIKIHQTVGRTGKITYLGEVEPVMVSNSKVSYLSLFNKKFILANKLSLNQNIIIKKSGDVIPKLVKVIDTKDIVDYKFSEICNFCKEKIKQIGGEQFCLNPNCSEIKIRKIVYALSRECLNINAISQKNVEKLFDLKLLTKVSDIFKLKNETEQLLKIVGMGEKYIRKIFLNIEMSKEIESWRFIKILSIKGIGTTMSKKIAKSLNNVSDIIKYDFSLEFNKINGLDIKTISAINEWKSDPKNIEEFYEILKHLKIQDSKELKTDKLLNMTVCISGKLTKPRDHYINLIEKHGGVYAGTLTKKTNYLLIGDNPKNKLEKAKKLSIKIITEKGLNKIINH